MATVSMHEAKTHLSRLVEEVARGAEVVITRSGVPVARLVPYGTGAVPRRPGALRGRIAISDNFDVLPAVVAAAFRCDSS